MVAIRIIQLEKSARRAARRSGYALLLCLLVALVSGMAVMGILDTARYETMEISAKQRSATATWAAHAGTERAVALLLDDPSLSGTLPAVQLPPGSGTSVTSNIQRSGQNITVTATATAGGMVKTQQRVFTQSQLTQRISSLP